MIIKRWFDSFYNSLFNNDQGFSGRKLTAMTLTVMVVIGDVKFFNLSEATVKALYIEWLTCHLIGIGFFMGLITVGNLIELKNGKKDTPS